MVTTLLLSALVIMMCIIFNKISSKIGLPALLAFIVLGMFFGSDGIVKIEFGDYSFAEKICSVALIFIMFYGGFGTKWSEAKPAAAKAVALSTLGVILTAGITAVFCYFILRIELMESMLIGAVISSTDAASVFSILRSKKLNLKYNTASLLEVESGSNDPCSYMLTAIILSVIGGKGTGAEIGYMVFSQIVYGLAGGVVIAFAAIWALKTFECSTDGFDAIFVVAIAILSYAAPSYIGGNGYLSAYIVGIIMGNSQIANKKSLVHFFDGVTGLMQMLIFFLLGLLSFPSQMPGVMLPAIAIALFIMIIARPLAVFAILTPMRCCFKQQILVAWSGLRGAASIVFAIMVKINAGDTNNDIFHIVFCVVLFSILLQGSLIPFMARKLNMIDDSNNVMKTFNDYTEEAPVQFIQLAVNESHPWVDMAVKDISLPPDTILALLIRGEEKIAPYGETVIQNGDMIILSAKAFGNLGDISLSEILIEKDDCRIGKMISELKPDKNKLIIMIQRNGEIVIPSGKTVLEENDMLVINETLK